MKHVTPEELLQHHQEGGVELIDVRTPVEFREIHVDFARNVPLERLDPHQLMAERHRNPDEPVYLICKSGSRGQMACDRFHAAGFTHVFNVAGGTAACVEADLPVTRGRKAVSLERQVRIAAGCLIVLGVVLGYTVHPWLHALAGLVGAGLVFAGVTDTCAMGMLMARMPWNQVKTCDSLTSPTTGSSAKSPVTTPEPLERAAG